ncbi:hypothetical protein LUZ60_008865 [Juncus effusus]|nr:hypothetical protein LUZ60_008865 [Juncus effusus]
MGSMQDEIIFRSKLPDIKISNEMPLHTYCFENLSQFSDRPCLIDGPSNKIYTYSDVDRLSRRLAVILAKLGLTKGKVIMNLLRNSPEFVFTFLAASRLGAVTTTANPFVTPGDIKKQLVASGAGIVVTEACAVEKVRDLAEVIITTDKQFEGCLYFPDLIEGEAEAELEEVEMNADDVVALPYSSGTTGLPKGVMLTHRSLITSVAQQVDGENPNLYFSEKDVILCVLPMFHIYSLNSILLCGLRVGAAILIMKKFELVAMMELVQKYGVTVAPMVPPIVIEVAKSKLVEKYDLSSIRIVMSGAAPMGKDIQDAFRSKVPNAFLGQGYGMTEAGPVLSMCLAFAKEPFEAKSGACGTVVRNAELKVIDLETGASLGRNVSGEICIRGQQIMKGYLNDLEATNNTIDKDGWLHTGDIGYVDDNDEIFIVDRLKEIIKYKGFQVPPAELEALLISHPDIADAAVVPMNDEVAGEVPVAYVVPTKDSELTEEEIKQYISKQVVFYKRVSKVFFIDAIPKAPSGKILRRTLREKLNAQSS